MGRIEVHPVLLSEAELGESPIWDAEQGCLWWTDIHARRIGRAELSSDFRAEYINLSSRAGALALLNGRHLLLAIETQFALLDSTSGVTTIFAALTDPAPGTRLNDGRVDPFGNFVCGSMVEGEGQPGSANLYRLSPDGEIETILAGITCANATCWSPDGAWLYFSDMPTGRVDRRRYGCWGEPLGEPEPFIQLDPGEGFPDGAVTDEEGGLWLAVWGGGKLTRFSADGQRTHELRVPTTNPTCPAFGGDGLRTLFFTTARFGLTEAQRAAEPLAGHIFACEPGVAGRHETRFRADRNLGQPMRAAHAV